MENTILVNVAFGSWYPNGQKRLFRTAREAGYNGQVLAFGCLPPGARPHSEVPYGFKYHAIDCARRMNSADVILWCDASIFFLKSPQPIVDTVRNEGCFLLPMGKLFPHFSMEERLPSYGMTKEIAESVEACSGWIFGFSTAHPMGVAMMNGMLAYATDGVSFPGKRPPHCHDETMMGVLAWRLGAPLIRRFYQYYHEGVEFAEDTIVSSNECWKPEGIEEAAGNDRREKIAGGLE